MPGWFKKAWYGLASLLSFSSFILIIVALVVPHWLSGKILCQTGVDLVNATDRELVKFIGDIYYGLFQGCKVRQCGLGSRQSQFTSKYIGGMKAVSRHLFLLLCKSAFVSLWNLAAASISGIMSKSTVSQGFWTHIKKIFPSFLLFFFCRGV